VQAALGSLASKAGEYVNGVYDWASQGWDGRLEGAAEMVRAGDLLRALTEATGFDPQQASAAVQEKG
jgi:hypothetical protein